MTFTTEELIDIAREAYAGVEIERDGLRFTFSTPYDDQTAMEYVNGMDALGRLDWPTKDPYSIHDRRPEGFTGAARKFGPNQGHDAIWWEPYRDEDGKVYDSPDDVAFMRDLLIYGVVGCSVSVERFCDCCDQWKLVDSASLWGIESPLCGNGNYEYIAEVFADLLTEAMEPA